ncbi:GABA permease [compost metagenome]
MASTAVGFLTTAINYFAPEKVFAFLLASSGAVALLVYLVIAISQLRMRRQLLASGKPLEFSMWLYPWLTWLVILFIVAALGIMLVMPDHRAEVLATGMLTVVIVCLGLLDSRKGKAKQAALGVARADL